MAVLFHRVGRDSVPEEAISSTFFARLDTADSEYAGIKVFVLGEKLLSIGAQRMLSMAFCRVARGRHVGRARSLSTFSSLLETVDEP